MGLKLNQSPPALPDGGPHRPTLQRADPSTDQVSPSRDARGRESVTSLG